MERRLKFFLACWVVSQLILPTMHAAPLPFFIGTNSAPGKDPGIFLGALDSETGKLGAPVLAADVAGPSFLELSTDGRFLYAALEQKSGAVGAYSVGADLGLTPLNRGETQGRGPCHVCVTKDHVLASNYGSGSVACLPRLADGSLGAATGFVAFTGTGPNPTRQTQPHAHGAIVSPDEKFAYVCDLGTDEVRVFQIDNPSGALTPASPSSAKVPAGGGPRHSAMSASGEFLYVNNEMGLSVSAFRRDAVTGELTLLQTLPVLPEGADSPDFTTSGIVLHPTGRWLYVSTRGHNSLSVFDVQPDGTLVRTATVACPVQRPREFQIDPSGQWLVVGGQDDGKIASMRLNPETGMPTPADEISTTFIPVSFAFVKSRQ